jgi:DNA-binding MarR family transcriptional regulator
MPTLSGTDLARLDAAVVQLRRLWESPVLRRGFLRRLGENVEPGLVRTLRALAFLGDEPGVADVATVLRVEASTASRLVDQAVAAGYATRRTARHDRRRSVLSLTPTGQDLVERANAVRNDLYAELTRDWSPDDLATLAALLERFAAAIDRMETPS